MARFLEGAGPMFFNLRSLLLLVALTLLPGLALAEEAKAGSASPSDSAAAPSGGGAVSDAAKELFLTKCASCHSIGEGARVGPDLKGVADRRGAGWLKKMIQTPSAMLDSDADARKLLAEFNNVRMPDLGLSDEQVATVVELLKTCSAQKCDLKGSFTPVTKATKDDVAQGVGLFMGTVPLTNGGPSCVSCHALDGATGFLGGGTLSKDLTNVFARLGDEGLDAALKAPSFAVMNKIFADAPLTAEEAFALRAAFSAANRGALGSPDDASEVSIILVSLVFALLILVFLNAAWARRQRGIRKALVARREQHS